MEDIESGAVEQEDIESGAVEQEEIELGGFEDEFANVMGFTVTSLLRIIERQQVLLSVIFENNPALAEAFAAKVDSGSSSEAAQILGRWLEECIDEETNEDSMLFQVHEQLISLAGISSGDRDITP